MMMLRQELLVLLLIVIASSISSISISNKIIQRVGVAIASIGLGCSPVLASTFTGTVSIAESAQPPTGALYITVRQDVGIWEAGVRNYKPPPIMAKKIPIDDVSVFPLKVSLDDTIDITEEGKDLKWKNGKKPKPLLFSARLDTDSNANTRSPTDLVGQIANIRYEDGSWQSFDISLGGRGGLGKVIVSK